MVFINIPDHIEKPPINAARLRELLPRFDLIGFALFAPASIMLLLALQFGAGDYGWKSPAVIGCFCGAGATALIFVLWEWRAGKDAMIPLEIISRKIIWTSCVYFALVMSATMCASSFVPIYLQAVKGLSPTMSAVYLLAAVIPQMLFVVISGALSKLRPFG
jgi:predicted MFS family arabinose efflux permease